MSGLDPEFMKLFAGLPDYVADGGAPDIAPPTADPGGADLANPVQPTPFDTFLAKGGTAGTNGAPSPMQSFASQVGKGVGSAMGGGQQSPFAAAPAQAPNPMAAGASAVGQMLPKIGAPPMGQVASSGAGSGASRPPPGGLMQLTQQPDPRRRQLYG